MYTDDVIKHMTAFKTLRLLMAQPMLMLPVRTHIRLLVTSADVLHSWAVPSFGIKIDACPGRLTQGSLYINRELNKNGYGVYFGQCSEICGVNHGFMPISILSVQRERFYLSGVEAEPFIIIRSKRKAI
jgi:heme/copper-type cytochrome/quinol oxidase subunit 2